MTQAALNIWSIVVLLMVIINIYILIYNAMQIHYNSKNKQIQELNERIAYLEEDLNASRATITRILHKYSTGRTDAKPRTDNRNKSTD